MPNVGDEVKVHCRGALADGRVFCDTEQAGEPLTFVIGLHTLLPAIEQAVLGMRAGDVLHLEVPAAQAYGDYDETLVEEVPASSLPMADQLPKSGYIVVDVAGEPVRVHVEKTDHGTVRLDHNHEFAGQDLAFDLTFLGLAPETALEHELHAPGCACGCDRLKESLAH